MCGTSVFRLIGFPDGAFLGTCKLPVPCCKARSFPSFGRMLTLVALLTLVSVASSAISDCRYTYTPCSCYWLSSCDSIACGWTVAEGGSKWEQYLRYTFDDWEKLELGKKCYISVSGRYSYSGSRQVTSIPIGTPTVSGDCRAIPASEVLFLSSEFTFDYTVENNGVVSLTSSTTQDTLRLFPDKCPPSVDPRIAILVSVLGALGVAILGFVCWRRKRARMTERGGQMISAPTYDMGLNEAFISAAQPSSQSPVVAVNMPATSPVFGADAKPQVAAHMSEQQAIISELRACGKQSLPKAELLSTPNFQALIVRLGTAQHELRELLKEGSLRPDDAKLLLRQSQLMLQLLSELTEGVDADSHSSGSLPPRYTVDNPQQPIIINTISTTSPVFGVDGKPIIINTISTTTPVFGADGKPMFHNHVILDLD